MFSANKHRRHMLHRAELIDGVLHIHEEKTSCAGTAAFKGGTIIIDPRERMIAISPRFKMPLPETYMPTTALPLKLQLVDSTGRVKLQPRVELLSLADPLGEIDPEDVEELEASGRAVLRVTGKSSQRARDKADGWSYQVLQFRAYLQHTGVETDILHPLTHFNGRPSDAPSYWLTDSIHRSRLFWNRMVRRCEYARLSCESAPLEDINRFISDKILPAIDTHNRRFGRGEAKMKMKHPTYLKVAVPTVDGLRRFAYLLKVMADEGSLVPEGLEETIREFVVQYPMDWTPINEFQKDIVSILKEEAQNFRLEGYESLFLCGAFQRVLKTRQEAAKTKKAEGKSLLFSEGWPQYKMGDNLLKDDWGLHFVTGKGNDPAEKILSPKGIRGVRLGDPIDPALSGHSLMGVESPGRKNRLKLRQATISLDHGSKNFSFAILQHRDIPENAFVKGWKLIHKDGQYWFNYIIEVKAAPPAVSGPDAEAAAGIDIGWRVMDDTRVRIGMFWNNIDNTYQELTLDLDSSCTATDQRVPFLVCMGASVHGRYTETLRARIAKRITDGELTPEQAAPLFEELILRGVDSYAGLKSMQEHRDDIKNTVKDDVAEILGAALPPQWQKVGLKGLRRLAKESDNPRVVALLQQWVAYDAKLGAVYAALWDRTAGRLEKGYENLAHDACKSLLGKTNRIGVEEAFLKKLSMDQSNYDADAIKNGQVLRQWAGLASFITKLKQIAPKYGMTVVEVSAKNTSAHCEDCGGTFTRGAELRQTCKKCGLKVDQDANAARNIGVAAGMEKERLRAEAREAKKREMKRKEKMRHSVPPTVTKPDVHV